MKDAEADVRSIRALVQRQFESMTWVAGASPEVEKFKEDFLPEARLYPSARPLRGQSIENFASRMSELARNSLFSFHERIIGTKINVFGNVAVAVVACESTENETEVNRNLEMMLLVKDDGRWKIASQAWDKDTGTSSIPSDLLGFE